MKRKMSQFKKLIIILRITTKIGEAGNRSTVNARDEGINNISSDIPNPQQKPKLEE